MDWINVKDKLPECSQEVIVTNGQMSTCARYDNKFNQFLQGHMDLTWHTTHWMPLPEPPKEE